jgi:type III pantothenate kinase
MGVADILLALNVGNSNITGAVWEGERLAAHFRLHTQTARTVDEYSVLIKALLAQRDVGRDMVHAVAICSVVPPLTSVIVSAVDGLGDSDPLLVGPGLRTAITLGYEDPTQLGPDRIANAEAAYARYGGPVIAVDMGTATTVDAVTGLGVFEGGAIAPGVGISVDALYGRASRLRRVDLAVPERAIGRNTADGLRSGVILGFAGQVDALVRHISRELGGTPYVVATGGLAYLIAPASQTINDVVPLLTLEGIRLIDSRNRAARGPR